MIRQKTKLFFGMLTTLVAVWTTAVKGVDPPNLTSVDTYNVQFAPNFLTTDATK